MKWLIKPALLLAITALFLFSFLLHRQCEAYREFEEAAKAFQRVLFACCVAWLSMFLFLSFSRKDLPLVGLFVAAVIFYFSNQMQNRSAMNVIAFFGGAIFGRGVNYALKNQQQETKIKNEVKVRTYKPEVEIFLMGLIFLLAFASWWHLDIAHFFYPGTRWTGCWDNPNTYGMLMGAGIVLAAGLLTQIVKIKCRMKKLIQIFLFIAIGIMSVGLMMSYSRGAWLATAIGLLYLAWRYGNLKWRYVLPGVAVVALVALYFWGSTADSTPWYVKRADLGRPSAQHRVSAWCAGLEIMRDHPFGVGWNKAVSLYDTHYSPPEGGAAALTTNDYMMVGTELGVPALLCFVTYVSLCYWKGPKLQKLEVRNQEIQAGGHNPELQIQNESEALRAACLAGALVFVVAFWFDGGLFKLATASVFWILLELGNACSKSSWNSGARR